jgi:hypothetical protein
LRSIQTQSDAQPRDVRPGDIAGFQAQLRRPQRAFEQRRGVASDIDLVLREQQVVICGSEGEALLPERIGKVLRARRLEASRVGDAQLAPIAALDDLIDADRAVHNLVAQGPGAQADGRVDRADPQAQSGVRSRPGGESVCLGRLERAARRLQLAVARTQQLVSLDERERAEIVRLAQGGRCLYREHEAEKHLARHLMGELAHEGRNFSQMRLTTD